VLTASIIRATMEIASTSVTPVNFYETAQRFVQKVVILNRL
jgi:hypothetical protein